MLAGMIAATLAGILPAMLAGTAVERRVAVIIPASNPGNAPHWRESVAGRIAGTWQFSMAESRFASKKLRSIKGESARFLMFLTAVRSTTFAGICAWLLADSNQEPVFTS